MMTNLGIQNVSVRRHYVTNTTYPATWYTIGRQKWKVHLELPRMRVSQPVDWLTGSFCKEFGDCRLGGRERGNFFPSEFIPWERFRMEHIPWPGYNFFRAREFVPHPGNVFPLHLPCCASQYFVIHAQYTVLAGPKYTDIVLYWYL